MTPLLDYLRTHGLELAGVISTVLGIWLTTQRRLLCWPVVLVADVIYLEVFYRARLFSDALLQALFVVFTLYGWWHWWRGARDDGEIAVVLLGKRGRIGGLLAGAAGAVVLAQVMVRVGAALPWLDATLASYSLVATWWAARKHIANWWLWIAVDVIYVGEYVYKGLQATAVLYAGLVALAILGVREWRRAAQEAKAQGAGGSGAGMARSAIEKNRQCL